MSTRLVVFIGKVKLGFDRIVGRIHVLSQCYG